MSWQSAKTVADVLKAEHYLGPSRRGFAWVCEHGVMVFSKPTARRLPAHWLDLTRWCLARGGTGSMQWARVRKALLLDYPEVTTVVSYSDPAVGHTGSLYRACGWLWAPTWHRLRPPPTGNGRWSTGAASGVKDRWVDCLRPDTARSEVLRIKDAAILRRTGAVWVEPKVRKGLCVRGTGGWHNLNRSEFL